MSFIDSHVNEEAVDDDGNEIVVKMATKTEVATGRKIQELMIHPDSPALAGLGGGLSGSTTIDLDTDYPGGTADLHEETPVAVWYIGNLAGAATVNLPATTSRFAVYLYEIADLSDLTLQVDGDDVLVTDGAMDYGGDSLALDLYPGGSLTGGVPVGVPINKIDATGVFDENAYATIGVTPGSRQTEVNGQVELWAANIATNKADLTSPDLDGTPTAPTAPPGTNTTQIATTAYADAAAAAVVDAATVTTALAGKQPLDSDLTAIAALTTTTIGRSLLAAADAAALRTILSLATVASTGAYSDLTGRPLKVVKGSDTARSSAPAISADPDLTLTVPAAGTYIGRAVVLFDSATNADLSTSITGPGGSTITGATHGPGVSAAAVPYTVSYLGAAGSAVSAGGVGVGTVVSVVIEFAITTTGSGAVAVQWTQASSQVTATTVKAGSTLRLEAI